MNNAMNWVSQKEEIPAYTYAGDSRSLPGPVLVGLCRDILKKGVLFRFSVPGTSMSPFIQNGDIITLVPYSQASCRSGDVVAFVQPGTERLVVHRVVGVSPEGCRIRGDNTHGTEEEIPHACIFGKTIRVERCGEVIRFGLGPERVIIALLSRWQLLPYCTGAAGAFCSVIRRMK